MLDQAGVAFDRVGAGGEALLLPALSSISTRHEMSRLATALGGRLRCTIPDWPGFGRARSETSRLSPDLLRRFLDALIPSTTASPMVGIGAGHAATFLVEAARRHPGRFGTLVLIAPTWRGPLPTMFDGKRAALCRGVRAAVDQPGLGHLLYRINVSRPVVAWMMREHVYADPASVTKAVLAEKLAVTRRPDARFATAAFVTGALDPVASRGAFLDLFAAGLPPVLLIRPDAAPRRSAAEMDAVSGADGVTVARVPGALSAHEEHPGPVAAAILRFLDVRR